MKHYKSSAEYMCEIEEKYSVDKIRTEDICVWQFLRLYFIEPYNRKFFSFLGNKKSYIDPENRLNFDINILKKFWKKYDAWLFTGSVNEGFDLALGRYFDTFSYGIEKYYKKNILILNESNIDYNHLGCNQYIAPNRIGIGKILSVVPKFIKRRSYNLYGKNILNEIQKYINFKIDYLSIIDLFYVYVDFFNLLFGINKPKIIFVVCYYSLINQALIYSARLNKIKVIELQHGLIINNHISYIINRNIGTESFPEFIFTYGNYYSKFLKNNFIPESNIYVIGNSYLEYSLKHMYRDLKAVNRFNLIKQTCKILVLITLPGYKKADRFLINFINKAALKDNNIFYMILMRKYNFKFEKYIKSSNIMLLKNFNFYQSVGFCDFHVTLYSTCFLEALKFGKPSILVNINGKIKKYLNDFEESQIISYVDTPEELYSKINSNYFESSENIRDYAKSFYEDTCFDCLQNSLRKIINE